MAGPRHGAPDATATPTLHVTLDIGAGLQLGPLCSDDAEPFAQAVGAEVDHLTRWLPHIAKLSTSAAVVAHLGRTKPFVANRCWQDLTIRDNDKIVGFISLYNVDRHDLLARVGYWVAQSHTGRGIARRAITRLCDFAFEDYGLHRLELEIALDNLPSLAVAEGAGFRLEGQLRGRFARGASFIDGALYARIRGD